MAGPGNSTQLLNTITLPEFTDLTTHQFRFLLNEVKPVARQLFMVDQIGGGEGEYKRYDEVDGETYADFKAQGADFTKSAVGVGYNVTMSAVTFGKEVEITYEMRRFNKYREVGAMMTDLSTFCSARQELDLTHRFTFATSTSYTDMNGRTVDVSVGDGLALLSSVHTLAFSSTTYSNTVTGSPVFSQGAFEAAKLLSVSQVYNNYGQKRTLDFNTIITGNDPSTVSAVKSLLESSANVDSNNAGVVNVYRGAMRHVILPDLATTAAGAYDSTKRKWWFIGAIGNGMYKSWQSYLGEWTPPTLSAPASGNNGEDIHNMNWTFTAHATWGIAVLSGRGLIGSTPTTS